VPLPPPLSVMGHTIQSTRGGDALEELVFPVPLHKLCSNMVYVAASFVTSAVNSANGATTFSSSASHAMAQSLGLPILSCATVFQIQQVILDVQAMLPAATGTPTPLVTPMEVAAVTGSATVPPYSSHVVPSAHALPPQRPLLPRCPPTGAAYSTGNFQPAVATGMPLVAAPLAIPPTVYLPHQLPASGRSIPYPGTGINRPLPVQGSMHARSHEALPPPDSHAYAPPVALTPSSTSPLALFLCSELNGIELRVQSITAGLHAIPLRLLLLLSAGIMQVSSSQNPGNASQANARQQPWGFTRPDQFPAALDKV
jgi:hypothetical protein